MKSQSFANAKDEVLLACTTALSNLELDPKKIDEKNGIVEGSFSGNLLSWGNDIEIVVAESGNQTAVSVKSTSKAQLIGWGTNDDLEESIINEISKILLVE